MVWQTLGKVWLAQRNYSEAEQAYRRSLDLAERLNDAHHIQSLAVLRKYWNRPHPEIAEGAMAFGAYLQERGDFVQALLYYREAEQIIQTLQLTELRRYAHLPSVLEQLKNFTSVR